MWPFRRKTSQRRVEARPPRRLAATAWRRFRDAGGVPALLLAILFYAGAVLMDAWPPDPLPYRPHQYIPADIHSRVSFKVASARLLEDKKREVENTTSPTFQINASFLDEIIATLKNLPDRAKAASQPAQLDEGLRRDFGIQSPEGLKAWRAYAEEPGAKKYDSQLERLRAALAQTCVVRPEDAAQIRPAVRYVLLAGPQGLVKKNRNEVLTPDSHEDIQRELIRLGSPFDAAIRDSVRSFLAVALGKGQPTYLYDMAATQKDIAQAKLSLEAAPPCDSYEAGQLLVRASRRDTPRGPAAGRTPRLCAAP